MSEFVDAETNSTGYFWFKIICGLSKELPNVHVISEVRSSVLAKLKTPSVNYTGVKSQSIFKNDSAVTKLIDSLVLSIRLSLKVLMRANNTDIVFCGTNPSFLVLAIAVIKIFGRFKWILLVNDVFPENLIAGKLASEESILYRLIHKLVSWAYTKADQVIVIGRDMERLILDKTQWETPVEYIPNWIDLRDMQEAPEVAYKNDDLTGEQRKIFQFFGNLGLVQGLGILLEAIRQTKNQSMLFRFIGSGADRSTVEQFITDNPHIAVELFPPVPFAENSRVLAAPDVSLVCLTPGMTGVAVPSKAYFSLAADVPILVIGEPGSELDLLIKENEAAGWFCDSSDISQIAKTLDRIAEMDLSAYNGRCRRIIKQAYNYEDAIKKYLVLIARLNSER